MYRLTLDMPNSAAGTKVELDGLGIFENGKSYDIKEEDLDLQTFLVHHNRHLPIQDEATREANGDVEFNYDTVFENTPGITFGRVLSKKELKELAKEYKDMTIPELKGEIDKRNEGEFLDKLSTSGNKDDLVNRLLEDDKGGDE